MKAMKTIFKWTLAALLCGLFPRCLTAQEVLTGWARPDQEATLHTRDGQVLTLPFYDDFSSSWNYPDTQKWADRNAYVNPGFPLHPITRNAATLDVLDAEGRVYDYAISNPFIAEHLTSNLIRLDSVFTPEPRPLTPADSLYLSFFYQPQGNGNAPEANDSLVLEFGIVHDLDTTWHSVWSAPGQTLEAFLEQNDGQYFKQVMIPIVDTQYFVNGFVFRFYNYASIVSQALPTYRGNEDNWNLDVVYLDRNRRRTDTGYPKLCFTGATPSFLKRYRSMPYRHYCTNPTANIRNEFPLELSNLDDQPHNARYHYTIDQVEGYQHFTSETETFPMEAGALCQAKTGKVDVLFTIDTPADSTSFLIRHYLVDNSVNPPLVDSLCTHQGFYNYFAYDDGIPEMGYGVEPASSSFAIQYEVSMPDTLQGVQILFNHTLNDANDKYFNIVVWKDNNGKPGEEIYRLSNRKPKWEDGLYRFVYYAFDQPVRLNGRFYVGIEQQGSGIINVGFDGSNDNAQYNFYNSTGSWQQSAKAGSIMIRPVVGARYFIGVDEPSETTLRLYPNPASEVLHIEGVAQGRSVTLFDLTGRKVVETAFAPEISLNGLPDGLYLVRIITADGKAMHQKISIRQ